METIRREAPAGILGFPVTPMDQQGRLDMQALEANLQFLLKEGLSAIFIGCGSGEFHALHPDEYREIVEAAVSAAKGKAPVYTGVGGNISHALQLARLSEESGADGCLILPPYLIEPEQEGLYEYLRQIIASTGLNAILYQRDNCVVTLDTLLRLAELPQLVGVKDGLGNMELNIELTRTLGDRLSYLNGMPMAEVTMPAYIGLGFKSYSSAISNYIPHISALFYKSLLAGDQETVNELYREVILPINRIRKQRKGYAVSLIKAGMELVGLPVGAKVRPPLIPVEQEHYRQLEQILHTAFERFPKESR